MDEKFRSGAEMAKSERQKAVEKEDRRQAVIFKTVNELYHRLAPIINNSKRIRIHSGSPRGYEGYSPLYIYNIEETWYGIRRKEKPTGSIQVLCYDHGEGELAITISYRYIHIPGYKNSAGKYVIDETQDGTIYIVSHSVDDFIFELGRYLGDI